MIHHDVLIVGSGVMGVALASSINSDELSVGIIESNPQPSLSRRNLSINQKSLNFLKDLDVWKEIEPNAYPYQKIKVWDQEGSGYIEFDSQEAGIDLLGHIVSEGQIQKSLIKKLETKKVSFYWNNKLLDIKNNTSDIICTTSNDQISCKFLIGCDGINSSVRDLGKFKSRSWSYNQTAIVANLKSPNIDSTIRQTFTKIGPLALLPINDDELTMIWSIDDKFAYEFLQKEKEDFLKEINVHFGENFGNLDFSTEIQHFPLNHLSSKTFAKDGIFLVGDAAHQIHPLAGLGLNAGLGDVVCLAKEINELGRSEVKKISQIYNQKRIPVNLALAASMEAFKRGFEAKNIWIRLLRNSAFNFANNLELLKKKFMEFATEL